jgi:ABC-type Fe3+ transport system substrate-binding protein
MALWSLAAADDVHPDHHLGEALHKGAPLIFKIRAPGAVPFYFSAGVLKNARHPNAAKLYIEYVLSEGQDLVISRDWYPLRNGSPAPQHLPHDCRLRVGSATIPQWAGRQREAEAPHVDD